MSVFGSSNGTQTETTETTGNATQTDTAQRYNTSSQTPQPPKKTNTSTQSTRYSQVNNGTQTNDAIFFDMTVDDATDAAMEDVEAEAQATREQEQRRTQNIVNVASMHLGEDVRDLPYLPISSASSSSKGPYPDLPAEDTSNPRGRPPKNPW